MLLKDTFQRIKIRGNYFLLPMSFKQLGRVLQKAISASPWLKFNRLFISTSLPTKRVQQNSFLYPPQPRKISETFFGANSSFVARKAFVNTGCNLWYMEMSFKQLTSSSGGVFFFIDFLSTTAFTGGMDGGLSTRAGWPSPLVPVSTFGLIFSLSTDSYALKFSWTATGTLGIPWSARSTSLSL